jgi:hypothetical protein
MGAGVRFGCVLADAGSGQLQCGAAPASDTFRTVCRGQPRTCSPRPRGKM